MPKEFTAQLFMTDGSAWTVRLYASNIDEATILLCNIVLLERVSSYVLVPGRSLHVGGALSEGEKVNY